MTALDALCPAATGIIGDHHAHPGRPHRCTRPALHITGNPSDPDHRCECGAGWGCGPTIAVRAREMREVQVRHEVELNALRATMADIVRAAAAAPDPT